MQFPDISVDSLSDKSRCGHESGRCRRESLIEALAAFSGVPLYLMCPVSPALDGLPSLRITCIELQRLAHSGGVLSSRSNNLTPDYRDAINYY